MVGFMDMTRHITPFPETALTCLDSHPRHDPAKSTDHNLHDGALVQHRLQRSESTGPVHTGPNGLPGPAAGHFSGPLQVDPTPWSRLAPSPRPYAGFDFGVQSVDGEYKGRCSRTLRGEDEEVAGGEDEGGHPPSGSTGTGLYGLGPSHGCGARLEREERGRAGVGRRQAMATTSAIPEAHLFAERSWRRALFEAGSPQSQGGLASVSVDGGKRWPSSPVPCKLWQERRKREVRHLAWIGIV
jgi:hypothetical protein